jgi:hypothetical protein
MASAVPITTGMKKTIIRTTATTGIILVIGFMAGLHFI